MDVTTGIVKSKASVVNTLLNVVRTVYLSNSVPGDNVIYSKGSDVTDGTGSGPGRLLGSVVKAAEETAPLIQDVRKRKSM